MLLVSGRKGGVKMFRVAALVGFAIVFAVIFLHAMIFPCRWKRSRAIPEVTLVFVIDSLVCLGLRISFVGLLLTGFLPVLFGEKLHGYLLMLHATCAPVFIGCAALFVLMRAERFSFGQKDADLIRSGLKCKGCWLTDSGLGAKVGFWVLAGLTIPLTMTIVLSMFPLFGTFWQGVMLEAHKWCALIFSMVIVFEVYSLLRTGFWI